MDWKQIIAGIVVGVILAAGGAIFTFGKKIAVLEEKLKSGAGGDKKDEILFENNTHADADQVKTNFKVLSDKISLLESKLKEVKNKKNKLAVELEFLNENNRKKDEQLEAAYNKIAELKNSSQKGGINATFIKDRGLAYETAIKIIQETGKSETVTKNILNIRATKNVPEQDELYNTIYREIKKGKIRYTRATTYESDPDLSVTRRFLEELGQEKNVRMVMIFESPYIQGGIITNSEAILGFRTMDGAVNHALYIKGPDLLVQDIHTMYMRALKGGVHVYQIKDFGKVIPAEDISKVIDQYKEETKR